MGFNFIASFFATIKNAVLNIFIVYWCVFISMLEVLRSVTDE